VNSGFFPLDRRLRLRRDSWTERLVETAARLATTQPSFQMAAETLAELTRVGISKMTVWRHHKEVASQVEVQLEREEQEIPSWVLWKDVEGMTWIKAQDPIEGHVSVSIDGSTVPIRGEGYREVKMVSTSEVIVEPRQTEICGAVQAEDQLQEETPAGPGDQVRGRQDGLKLGRHGYRAVLGDKETFATALKVELARRRVQDASKITTVNDGADWIWDLAQRYLPTKRAEVLDWPHALQNLAKAANAAFGEGSEEARTWLDQRETELWNGERMQVDKALQNLPRRYKERGQAIRQVRDYIDGHWPRLCYADFRAEDRPIGSGTVESAAKNVVASRMKRGGQSWSREGATRMLAALGEVHSKRWSATHKRFARAA
jgi:hypothetical protein